jgi:hypothetical protein
VTDHDHRVLSIIAAGLALLLLGASVARAQTGFPYNFLVQSRVDGVPQAYGDPLILRRHDFGPGAMPVSGDAPSPLGYAASDNVNLWTDAVAQTWSYCDPTQIPLCNPTAFTRSRGDGGQIIAVDGDGVVRFWATQDGSYNGLQFFVGNLCPLPGITPATNGDGWVLFDNQVASGDVATWVTRVAQLAISKVSPTACPPLGPGYTRYMREPTEFLFQAAGVPTSPLLLDTILTEHYDHATIDDSVNMERNYFAQGFGNLRWESWTTSLPPGADLAARCPPLSTNGYYSVGPGWYLRECRNWTNFVLAPANFTLQTYGWPYTQ